MSGHYNSLSRELMQRIEDDHTKKIPMHVKISISSEDMTDMTEPGFGVRHL